MMITSTRKILNEITNYIPQRTSLIILITYGALITIYQTEQVVAVVDRTAVKSSGPKRHDRAPHNLISASRTGYDIRGWPVPR